MLRDAVRVQLHNPRVVDELLLDLGFPLEFGQVFECTKQKLQE